MQETTSNFYWYTWLIWQIELNFKTEKTECILKPDKPFLEWGLKPASGTILSGWVLSEVLSRTEYQH